MRTCVLCLLAAFVVAFSGASLLNGAAAQAKKTDEERILGSWVLVKGQANGRDMPAETFGVFKMTFFKNGRIAFDVLMEEKIIPDLRYKIAGAGKIDFGPDKDLSPGIYRFDNDERLTICLNNSNDGKRPTEFESKKGSQHVVWVLDRAKSDDKMTPEEKANAKAALEKATQKVREDANRAVSANSLRQIAICFHSYHDVNKALPLHAIYSKDGRTPLLSWRVTILPYIEQQALYERFKLDEPWDSEHNKRLIPLMPQIYASPVDAKKKDGMTHYQVVTGPDTVFDATKKMRFDQVTSGDGLSNTILVIDAAEPVIWTKPQDLVLPEEKGKMLAVGGLFPDNIQLALCDSSVRAIVRRNLTPDILRALVTPNGGEKIDWDKILKYPK